VVSDSAQVISFRLQQRMQDVRGDRPYVVLLGVGQDYGLEMLPNPFTPRSTISRTALEDLDFRGLLPSDRGARFALRNLSIAGWRVPDIEVSVGAAATLLRVDGILGFDFFARFAEIRFNPRTFVMTLVQDA
jgi:hypothetical protein